MDCAKIVGKANTCYTTKLMERNWDNAIILDACRYDYFKEVCGDYLDGTLEKVRSAGTDTFSWFNKNFKDRYDDIVYVSANPYINSKVKVGNLDARNKFYKIIDVWDRGWDEVRGTVHPREVSEAVKKTRFSFPNKRFIIHYMQPHYPYLNLEAGRYRGLHARTKNGYIKSKSTSKLRRILGRLIDFPIEQLMRSFGHEIVWMAMRTFGVPWKGSMHSVWRDLGKDGLRCAYKENLRLVLESVSEILSCLDGKIIVTSDHGELLGENGYYGHPRWRHDSSLVEVPWFEVSKE